MLTLLIIATITFFLMNMIPGGPFNTERASAKTVEMMEAKYGLDKPLLEQFGMYMKRLIRFDLGDSYKRIGFTVNQILGEKFPISAGVGGVAIALAVLIGVPAGVLAAFKHNKPTDRIVMLIANLGIAVPNFVMATALLFLFGVKLGWLPTLGLKRNGDTRETIAEKMNVNSKSLQRWLKEPDRKINADFIVLLALTWRLPDWISALLLDRAYIQLSESNRRHLALQYILKVLWSEGVEKANAYLTARKLDCLSI